MADESAAIAAMRLLLASLAMAVLPGALIALAWRPRRAVTLLELTGLGVAISLILVQALTIAAITLHQPSPSPRSSCRARGWCRRSMRADVDQIFGPYIYRVS